MVAVATLVAFLGFGGGNSYFCETPWVRINASGDNHVGKSSRRLPDAHEQRVHVGLGTEWRVPEQLQHTLRSDVQLYLAGRWVWCHSTMYNASGLRTYASVTICSC
eukprot:m.599693 g.599693  ORF g.599693 m.599693 type:complete len:106 (+) comp22428_c0_seq1:866-1183(+)